jgi:hypothetical protein
MAPHKTELYRRQRELLVGDRATDVDHHGGIRKSADAGPEMVAGMAPGSVIVDMAAGAVKPWN